MARSCGLASPGPEGKLNVDFKGGSQVTLGGYAWCVRIPAGDENRSLSGGVQISGSSKPAA